jgi:hypothetical protein
MKGCFDDCIDRVLAREAFKVRWGASYFVTLAIWRVGVSAAGAQMSVALTHAIPFAAIGAIACAILY